LNDLKKGQLADVFEHVLKGTNPNQAPETKGIDYPQKPRAAHKSHSV